jgi:D-alanyl-D-alanine carboxypeptidase (penicillin-binding protein 5/6)
MTGIMAIESIPLDTWTVSDTDATMLIGSSVMGLRPGQYITMRDLLYGLMLPSGNDAAIEIAKHVYGTEQAFVEQMNKKAQELGLTDTNFRNPHGLDSPRHYSSAYDLALLGRYAMANEQFRQVAGAQSHWLAPPSDYELFNGNSLLQAYPGADGIKIGWTEDAGWTLVASAVRDGHRVVVTVLDSEDRDADAAALLDWAFTTYRWEQISPQLTRLVKLMDRIGLRADFVKALSVCA